MADTAENTTTTGSPPATADFGETKYVRHFCAGVRGDEDSCLAKVTDMLESVLTAYRKQIGLEWRLVPTSDSDA